MLYDISVLILQLHWARLRVVQVQGGDPISPIMVVTMPEGAGRNDP